MTRALRNAILVVLLFAFSSGVVQTQDDVVADVSVTPENLTGGVCGGECYHGTITVIMSPRDVATIEALDIVFLLDISNSMRDVLNAVRENTSVIAAGLHELVPDTRFGLGIFSDYSDLPWKKLSDLQADLDQLNVTLADVDLESGGDAPESQARALWEALSFDWREDALPIVMVFTDAPPHMTDYGRDGRIGTDDDLQFREVLETYAAAGIRVIGINSGGSSAEPALLEAAEVTDGSYFRLAQVGTIAQDIVEQVTGIVLSQRLQFYPSDNMYDDWIQQTPSSLDYVTEGGTQTVEITICPDEHTHMVLTVDTQLELRDAEKLYASIPLSVAYNPHCVLLNIPDYKADDGLLCNNDQVFWESPAIVVSSYMSDKMQMEIPKPGQANDVFVQVRNLGMRSTDAIVSLYTSPKRNIGFDATDWLLVGRSAVTLQSDDSQWAGPFTWTPQSQRVALRAEVESSDDPIEQPENYACEGQIAQYNLITVPLRFHSFHPGLLSGHVPTSLIESLPSEDRLRFAVDEMAGDEEITDENGERLNSSHLLPPEAIQGVTISAKTSERLRLSLVRDGKVHEGLTLLLEYDPDLLTAGAGSDRPTSINADEESALLSVNLPLLLAGILMIVVILVSLLKMLKKT